MISRLQKYLILMLAMGLVSCVREEMVPYDKSRESKMAVFGFLTPAERINIFVSKAQPFGLPNYQTADFEEKNAIVTLADENGKTQTLTVSATNPFIYSCAQKDFPIEAGKKYSLTVKGSNGQVSASTTVPTKAAKWKSTRLSHQEYSYYVFSGSWEAQNLFETDYGVSINIGGKVNPFARTNENITKTGELYTVHQDAFMPNSSTLVATLLTRDKALGDFSRKADLTLDVIENLSNSSFTDIISGFKGVIPNAGNINGGIGVFGSYLTNTRTVYK